MKMHTKNTFRTMLAMTVASGLLVTGCGFRTHKDVQQPRVDTSNMHAPRDNPNFRQTAPMAAQQEGMRAPAGNVASASAPASPSEADMYADDDMYAGQDMYAGEQMYAQSAPQPQAQQKSGMFDWAWARKPEPEQQPQVNTMERRVPALNQNPTADAGMGMASYESAAPVSDVYEGDMAPQQGMALNDVIAMDDAFTPVMIEQPQQSGEYPALASVPPRPERIDAIRTQDARMADLEQERAQSYAQSRNLEAQVAADAPGSMLPQTASAPAMSVDDEFAALVAAEQSVGQPMVIVEDQPAVVVSQGSDMYQQPAPISMAAAPVNVVATDSDSGWQPAPLTPQTAPATSQPVQENQWVSLQSEDPAAQMAVPVEQVTVGSSQVAAVPANAYVPNNAVGGIQLTPPSAFGEAGVRTLPESRYAGRREAVYMQRYSRMQPGN